MNSGVPIWAYVLGILGVGGIITAAITQWGARRTTSGRVDTTEAAKLWDESNLMRQELRNEVVALRAQGDQQSGKIELLVRQNETLRDKHEECRRDEALLRQRVENLEKSVRKTTTARRRT